MSDALAAHDARLPIYQRLRDALLARIQAGEWPAGSAIPTEAELTRSYGVAIGTVRKAVEMLVAEGLLERNQGRGTFVRRPSFDASLFRFFRHQTSGEAQQVPQGKIIRRQLARPPVSVAQQLALPGGVKAIRLDRQRLVDGKVVLVEEIWLPQDRFAPLLEIELGDFGDLLYPLYEQRCAQVVASAKETLTVAAAEVALAEQLGIAPASPVVVIERLAFGYDARPLEWRRSYGAAAGFCYQVDIR